MVSASSATDPVDQTTIGLQQSRCTEQRQQADLDRADAGGAGLQRGVDRVGGVVAMGMEDRQQGAADVPSVPVLVPGFMAVGLLGRGVRLGVLLGGHLVRMRSTRGTCNRARAQ